MKVLYSWLKEFVKVGAEPELIAERLNFAGIAVDALQPVKPTFKGVITARILNVRPHPNADKLQLALVDYGRGTVEVVCGATNIRPGQIVPFAPVGASLKNGEWVLEAKKIRGVLSQGMLCSEAELDLGQDASGIFILSDELGEDIPLGKKLEEVLNLEDDYLFEFELPSNRPDCYSVYGIAREVAALFDADVTFPEFELVEEEPSVSEIIKVKVEDETLCPRYTAKVVSGVKNGRSPFWMRWRLLNAGLRSISTIVDVTNYVMLETGQPLHAFDSRFIAEKTIIVRPSTEGEIIVTLDGVERPLKKGMLLITDPEKPVALAGIMGAANSEVREDTTEVIIESAHFDPKSIMRTSRILGLNTDASTRFEKRVDPEGTVFAARRAAYLIKMLAGGKVAKGEVDIYLEKESERKLAVRHSRIESVIGMRFASDSVKNIFKRLEFKPEFDGEIYYLTIPSFRGDIKREIDTIEEVARIYGYDRLPAELPANSTLGGYEEEIDFLRIIRERALRSGFTEVITNPLLSERLLEITSVGSAENQKLVRPVNPLSADMSVLTPLLSLNLLQVVRNNYTRGQKNLRFFELARVFKATDKNNLPKEKTSFAAVVCGASIPKQWWTDTLNNDLFDLKGLMENILSSRGDSVCFVANDGSDDPVFDSIRLSFLERGKSALIMVGDSLVGFLGEVKERVLRELDIDDPVFVLEFYPDLLKHLITVEKEYRPIPIYPAIIYDLSLLVSRNLSFIEIRQAIEELKLDHLESISIFDLYTGRGIPTDRKSVAIRLVFRSRTRTLKEDEVRESFERVKQLLTERFSAEIRGGQ
jgi:phenylalanyl-tRNA synthetase beta chain